MKHDKETLMRERKAVTGDLNQSGMIVNTKLQNR